MRSYVIREYILGKTDLETMKWDLQIRLILDTVLNIARANIHKNP